MPPSPTSQGETKNGMTLREEGHGGNTAEPHRYRVLVEFAHRHLDFLLAELQSVLQLNAISLGETNNRQCECYLETLLHQDRFDALVKERSKTDAFQRLARRPFVILSFSADSKWAPLQHKELGHNGDQRRHGEGLQAENCMHHPSIAQVLLERCVLVRSVIELWAMAPSIEECALEVKTWTTQTSLGRTIYDKCRNGRGIRTLQRSWKFSIHTLGCTFTREEHVTMRGKFHDCLQIPGPVQMKDPDDEYIFIREVELDYKGGPMFPLYDFQKQVIPENQARPPLCCYFGRVLEGARSVKGRGHLEEYSLKNRGKLRIDSMGV